jgi:hypothetical protein
MNEKVIVDKIISLNLDDIFFDVDYLLENKQFEKEEKIELENNISIKNEYDNNIFISCETTKHVFFSLEPFHKLLKPNESLNLSIKFIFTIEDLEQKDILDNKLKIKICLGSKREDLIESNIQKLLINRLNQQKEPFEKTLNIYIIYNCMKLIIDKSDLILRNKKNIEYIKINNYQDKKLYNLLISEDNLSKTNEKIKIFQNIEKIKIHNYKIINQNSLNLFPNMKKLTLRKCHNCILKFPEDKCFKLKNIKFERLKLISESVAFILTELLKNKSISHNLETLSFRKNQISYIDINSSFIELCKDYLVDNDLDEYSFSNNLNFKNLKEFDLENNSIYHFPSNNINFFPTLKVLNLSYNNFTYPIDYNALKNYKIGKNVLFIFTANLFVSKYEMRNIYFQELNSKFQKINYPINRLNLDYLFGKKNFHFFKELNLNNYQDTIKYLNLGYCNLSNENIIDFFKNRFIIPNLKELNLKGNLLNDDFFILYIKNEVHLILKNLKLLNVSDNEMIQFQELNDFYNFISVVKLTKFIIYHTKFEDYIINNIKLIIKDSKAKKKVNNNKSENINSLISKNDIFNKFLKFIQEENQKLYISIMNKKSINTYKKYIGNYSNNIVIK